MKNLFRVAPLTAFVFLLLLPNAPLGAYGTPQTAKQSITSATAAKSHAPSAQEIADAKAKGLVWVNLSTHVYHKGGSLYGNTKRGKFMTEEDAKKAGYRLAKEP